MTLKQLERDISNLPPLDFSRLAEWIAGRDQHRCNRQFEAEVAVGKLNALGEAAITEHRR